MNEDKVRLELSLVASRRQLHAAAFFGAFGLAALAMASETTIVATLPSPSGVFRRLIVTRDVVLAREGGTVGIGGNFAEQGGTGVSVLGKNVHVQGPQENGWLRLGDAWGKPGVYAEAGDLMLGGQSLTTQVGDPGKATAILIVNGGIKSKGTLESDDDVCTLTGGSRRCLSEVQAHKVPTVFPGKSPVCPAGQNVVSRDYSPKVCVVGNRSCTTPGGWGPTYAPPACNDIAPGKGGGNGDYLCKADSWSKVLCAAD